MSFENITIKKKEKRRRMEEVRIEVDCKTGFRCMDILFLGRSMWMHPLVGKKYVFSLEGR